MPILEPCVFCMSNYAGSLLRPYCLKLLEAASRDDCSQQALRDLGNVATQSEENWSQALPVLLKHLSFPLQPLPDIEDESPEHPLDILAATAFCSVLERLGGSTNTCLTTALIVHAAPDIWRWLSRWTHTALFVRGKLAIAFRVPILERVILGVHCLTRDRNYIVPQAVDVVIAHFCLAGRSVRLQATMQDIWHSLKLGTVPPATSQIAGPDLEQHVVVIHLEIVIQSTFFARSDVHAGSTAAVRAAWLQHDEDILDHVCMHLGRRYSGRPEKRALENTCRLVCIIGYVVDGEPEKTSVYSEELLRRVIASALGVYHSAIRFASGTASEAHFDDVVTRLCKVCCHVLLVVISGQQSSLRSSTLLSWALRMGMLQALVGTPRKGTDDEFAMHIGAGSGIRKVDTVNYLLHAVTLRRMWTFPVYQAVLKSIGEAPYPPATRVLERWAAAHSAVCQDMVSLKSECHYSSVSFARLGWSQRTDSLQCPELQSSLRKQRCAGCGDTYFCSASCQRESKIQHRLRSRYRTDS
jgi:hypothetical protein